LHDEAKAAYDIEVKAERLDDEAIKAELKEIADAEAVARGGSRGDILRSART